MSTAYKPCIYNGASSKPSILVKNHHIDTTIWNDVKLVDSDIFINTPAKSGTTWTQEIVLQLLYNGRYEQILNVDSAMRCIYLD